ncbi:DUF342 domain-containing protein [Pseudodesulfovibrio piezophilus]|uniref:DUF342 domain-containing protein n=1 Tax=Pseudodesulfovibrio piezophilus (strain DSM 21447 / JCM 15486 / C1TLV30) TaxID=1322246 RepID=M1WQE5_PSEP2|nr:FapA family protein [Pseudodesulfovibrio piezophilus]CCH47662.1 conserved protein of unknown function [Pseudodesulfovibrio piezophilus C1TLV30]
MPFLLKHHFDPDLDLHRLKPQMQDDGSVDHHELNFVQNVEIGMVLAEWWLIEDAKVEEHDSRFIYDDMTFPAGKGTGIKRSDPNKLYAAVNGCVGYIDGKIVVKESLTLPNDIDFHTGNINFIGNLIVGGSIRSGFSAHGRDITVQGQVEAAHIEALRDLNCRGGVKGGKEAFLEAGRSIKVSFCEFGTLKAGEDVLVKGALMHSDVYAGNRLAVGGRLTGGHYYCHDYIYVGGQLGGGLGTDTALVLGYNPTLLYADGEYNKRIKLLNEKISKYEGILHKSAEKEEIIEDKLKVAQKELTLVKMLKRKLWEGIRGTEHIEKCKVLVTGVVKPGVEISIGSAYLKVNDFLEDVYFYYENDEVKIGAAAKKLKR